MHRIIVNSRGPLELALTELAMSRIIGAEKPANVGTCKDTQFTGVGTCMAAKLRKRLLSIDGRASSTAAAASNTTLALTLTLPSCHCTKICTDSPSIMRMLQPLVESDLMHSWECRDENAIAVLNHMARGARAGSDKCMPSFAPGYSGPESRTLFWLHRLQRYTYSSSNPLAQIADVCLQHPGYTMEVEVHLSVRERTLTVGVTR